MARTGRWFNCPCRGKRIGFHQTLAQRFRRRWHQALKPEPPVFLMSSYCAPIYPEKYRGKRE